MQLNLEPLKEWFFRHTEGIRKPHYRIRYKEGNKWQQSDQSGSEDANLLWENLKTTLLMQAKPGREMEVSIKSGVTGNYTSYPLEIPVAGGASVAGVSNINGNYIAAIESRFEERLERERERMQYERKLEKLEEMIEGIQEQRMDWFDKTIERVVTLLGVLENPNVAGLVGNLIAKGQGLQVQPNIAGTKAAMKAVVREQAATADEQPPPPIEQEEIDDEFFKREYRLANQAVDLLTDAGHDNPGELLLKVAQFAVENPDMAKSLLKNIAA